MADDLADIRLRGDELIGEAALKDLLVIGDSRRLEEAQKRSTITSAANLLPSKTVHGPFLGHCQITKKSRAIRCKKGCRNGGSGIQGVIQNRPRWYGMFCPRVKRISMTQTRVKRSDGAKFGMISLPNFPSKERDGHSRLFLGITLPANFTVRK